MSTWFSHSLNGSCGNWSCSQLDLRHVQTDTARARSRWDNKVLANQEGIFCHLMRERGFIKRDDLILNAPREREHQIKFSQKKSATY
jgi:hypothetical protein